MSEIPRRKARLLKIPPAVDVYHDEVDEFRKLLGHNPDKVLRMRVGSRTVEVDVLTTPGIKLTVTHAIIGREDDEA